MAGGFAGPVSAWQGRSVASSVSGLFRLVQGVGTPCFSPQELRGYKGCGPFATYFPPDIHTVLVTAFCRVLLLFLGLAELGCWTMHGSRQERWCKSSCCICCSTHSPQSCFLLSLQGPLQLWLPELFSSCLVWSFAILSPFYLPQFIFYFIP